MNVYTDDMPNPETYFDYMYIILCLTATLVFSVLAKILYRARHHSWLKCVDSFTHMPSGSHETQLLVLVLHTTQRKHALSDLGGVCMTPYICTPLYVWMPPYVWTTPYVGMPPVHTQHKESMLCQTKGVSLCPHTFVHYPTCLDPPCMFGCPHILDIPHMFGHPHMFGPPYMFDVPYFWTPPYVSLSLVCLDATICLGAPCMFGQPHLCLDTPYMFVCPICLDVPSTYTTQRKHALSD